MNKIKKTLILVMVILVLALLCYFLLLGDKENDIKKIEVVDSISEFGYELHDNEITLYKNTFEELKRVLNVKPIDYNKYGELISKLYAIDFYTLDNKVTNHDIGGTDFWHPGYVEVFRTKAKDTVYKYVQSNVYKDRDQELPIVKSVEMTNISSIEFDFDEVKDEKAIIIDLNINYEKDLGYPDKVTVTLVHDGKKLYIVEVL
jgi:hypothetical protein